MGITKEDLASAVRLAEITRQLQRNPIVDIKDLLNDAMDELGIIDDDTRAGVAAICSVEGADGRPEISYAHTSIDRIRQVFPRLRAYSDDQLNAAKVDPRQWFELVYGGMYGNDEPGDGYKFRGRGPIQLTFHDNYEHVGNRIGYDLVRDPDLVSRDPHVGALSAAAYIAWRYKGGGFEKMLKCVGNNTPDIRQRKLNAYADYLENGEFAYGSCDGEAGEVQPAPVPPLASAPNRPWTISGFLSRVFKGQ